MPVFGLTIVFAGTYSDFTHPPTPSYPRTSPWGGGWRGRASHTGRGTQAVCARYRHSPNRAKRLECAQLAAAVARPAPPESPSKLAALPALRESLASKANACVGGREGRKRFFFDRLQGPGHHFRCGPRKDYRYDKCRKDPRSARFGHNRRSVDVGTVQLAPKRAYTEPPNGR